MISSEEMDIDVLAVSPPPPSNFENMTPGEKKYYCQRCLNHQAYHPRKGHKPYCKFSVCNCENCSMVETRRQLNNKLKKPNTGRVEKRAPGERKERVPNCARCSAHGIVTALRGHKKSLCQFQLCDCEKCILVVHRRDIMARQIKLRRNQQKARLQEATGRNSCDSVEDSGSDSGRSPSPDAMSISVSTSQIPVLQPMPMKPLPMPIMPRLPPLPIPYMGLGMGQIFLSQLQNINQYLQTNPTVVEMAFQMVQRSMSHVN